MMRLFLAILAIAGSILILGGIGCALTSDVQQVGTAAGVRYELANSGSQGYSFTPAPTGFSYERRSWFGMGPPTLEVAVENGRILVDKVDRGPINAGEKLTVTSESRVLVNDQELRP